MALPPGIERSFASARVGSGWLTCGWLALALLFWGALVRRLSVDWSVNPQYGYGWSVPFLAAWLFWRRWLDRPEPRTIGRRWPLGILMVGLLLVLLPARLIEEANPEWRLVLWIHALSLVAVTLGFLHLHGGWGWTRHFAFPIGFLLVAVPWPSALEQALIQGLTQLVAAVTVEVIGIFGIVAVRHGNLIEVASGMVGVDEACSGVRSLQTSVMISLFFGELHRFRGGRRLSLLLLGVALAVAANLGRTLFLVWNAARNGLESVERWHDPAGLIILVAVFAGLWFFAWQLNRRVLPNQSDVATASPHASLPTALPRWTLVGLTAWLAVTEAGTELWYWTHERQSKASVEWSFRWPAENAVFREVKITDKARAILRCDEGRGGAWKDEARNFWLAFFLQWKSGRNSAQLAKGHTPDICMPATGQRLVRELEPSVIQLGGVDLPFRRYEFTAEGKPLFVFHCIWESSVGAPTNSLRDDWTPASRLESVRAGRRHLGQQVLQIALSGPQSMEEAEVALARELERRIKIEGNAGR